MANMARVGDTIAGTCNHGQDCCPHSVTGQITGGSPTVDINGKKVARQGDTVVHNCPHCGSGTITGGSATVHVNGKAVARQGDSVQFGGGSGTILTGSTNVDAQ